MHKKIKPIDITKGMKASELVDQMSRSGVFGAGRIAKASKIFEKMILRGFPDNKILNPRGIMDFGFTKTFDDPRSGVTVNMESLILVNEDYKRIFDWIYSGQGRGENIPAEVELAQGIVLPHYLNLEGMRFTDDEVEVGLIPRKGIDHFFQNAESLTFELLRKEGYLPDSIMVDVRYLIVPANLKLEQAITTVTFFSIFYTALDLAHALAVAISQAFDAVGTGIIAAIAQAAATAAHFALTLALLIQTGARLKEVYFPTLRNMKAISDFNLIKKGFYAPQVFAKRTYKEQTEKRNITFVAKRYFTVADSTISLSEEEKSAYYKEHKNEYKQDA